MAEGDVMVGVVGVMQSCEGSGMKWMVGCCRKVGGVMLENWLIMVAGVIYWGDVVTVKGVVGGGGVLRALVLRLITLPGARALDFFYPVSAAASGPPVPPRPRGGRI